MRYNFEFEANYKPIKSHLKGSLNRIFTFIVAMAILLGYGIIFKSRAMLLSAIVYFITGITVGMVKEITMYKKGTGVELKKDCLTYCQYQNNMRKTINIKIPCKNITEISAISENIDISSADKSQYIVPNGKSGSYVKILVSSGNSYYLPVENPQKFISDLTEVSNAND